MKSTSEITNTEDIIDSRDIIARIKYLESSLEDCDHSEMAHDGDCPMAEDHDELNALLALADEGEAAPDWPYGEPLIRDSYFRDYAEQLAEDIGAINRNAIWPLNHIDWEAAAEALQADYMSVDFDGVTYWIRG